jgi:predicted nucleic acid-binding protein
VNFLLDTNVISEWTKPRPNEGVIRWLADADEDRVLLSVVTLAELRYGVERLPVGARRRRLDGWLNGEILTRFEARILPVDAAIAHAWGAIVARRDAAGRPIGNIDAFIAATAKHHELALVTRDVTDFEGLGLRLIDPWGR